MKGKKASIILAMTLLGIAIPFTGCSSAGAGSSAQEEADYKDDAFIKDLAKALEARWRVNADYDKKKDKMSDSEQQDAYEKFADAELDKLSDYKNARFKNSKLQEDAIAYINCLEDQKTACKYYTSDDAKFIKQWSSSYDERTKLIKKFVNEYGLKVSDKYQDNLKELIENADSVEEDDKEKDSVDAMAKAIKFKKARTDDTGWATYTCTVKNTTGKDLQNITFSVNLLDKDGTIVEEQYINVNNLKQGQKAKESFQTDTKFSKTDVSVGNYQFADE